MPDEPTDEQMQRIAQAIVDGRKIEAIRLYREATGKGLKESKEFVEALTGKLRESDPEKYAAAGQAKGCGTAALLCIGVAIAVVGWWMAAG